MRGELARNPAVAPAIDPDWAWKPYVPDAERPWGLRYAGHLFRRAGFGANWVQLQQALKDGPGRTIERLLRPEADVNSFNRTYDQFEETTTDSGAESVENLAQWWLRRMIDTSHPLLERMTLFWHSFFGTSNALVRREIALVHHVHLLRQHALGKFAPLLAAVCSDPATLISTGAAQSYRAKPNLSFPRALLEGFTLGPGNYAEDDVQNTARAFTGRFVTRGEFHFRDYEHDDRPKRICGQEGPWKPEDVVPILLRQPATAQLLARRLYRWLISDDPEPSLRLIAPLAEHLGHDYDVGKLVALMISSNLFFSPAAYRQKVKSPVDYALNIVKALGGLVPTQSLGRALTDLGQTLGQPPTFHGWAGGRAWINPATLLGRSNLALAMLAGEGPYADKLNPWILAQKSDQASANAAGEFLLDLLLQGDVPPSTSASLASAADKIADRSRNPDQWARRYTHLVVTLPEFHLA
jgi:uncharacterized protein (DUF1800 family)